MDCLFIIFILFTIFIMVWSCLGIVYNAGLYIQDIDIPNQDKRKLVIVLSGPFVWIWKVGEFIHLAFKPLFKSFDEWVRKE